jgi:hypothetical protein
VARSNLDLPPAPVPEPPPEIFSPSRGPRFPADTFRRRLGWACLISALLNFFLWRHAADFVGRSAARPPQLIEIQRIILPKIVHPKPKPPKKIIKPKPIIKKIVKPKPIIKPKLSVKPRPVTRPKPAPRPKPAAPPPAHHHILTSKGLAPATHTALPGGHAQLGRPIAHQNEGEGHDNNQVPTPPTPKPPTPIQQQPPTPAPPKPPTPAPPKPPAGPTQDATFDPGRNPEIPDELKQEDFKSFVRVKVIVHPDGSFTPTLRTSSGNSDIDRLVLDSLKRYGRAKPALQNGVPVEGEFLFKYEFEVD